MKAARLRLGALGSPRVLAAAAGAIAVVAVGAVAWYMLQPAQVRECAAAAAPRQVPADGGIRVGCRVGGARLAVRFTPLRTAPCAPSG